MRYINKEINYCLGVFFLFFCFGVWGQVEEISVNGHIEFRGEVLHQETYKPIPNVTVYVKGGISTKTKKNGSFVLMAKIGDEIVITHPRIEPVSKVLESEGKIQVLVKDLPEEGKKSISYTKKKSKRNELFYQYLDSANLVYRNDVTKSIQYVTKSFETSKKLNKNESGLAYKTLGDIYFYWKQYDLAISNYLSSLIRKPNNQVQLSLAKSYLKNKSYDNALDAYKKVDQSSLSPLQCVLCNEEIGDVYVAKAQQDKAKNYYQKGLDLAQKHNITPKITDLNSKLGTVSYSLGEMQQASVYFDNSLNLAKEENVQRATIQKERVADFYNLNRMFDKEIELRKKNLVELEDMDEEVITRNGFLERDSITTQRTNYKIANAYIQQQKFNKAIPYLEKSINEADKKEDLVVQTNATRKLSEVYNQVGNYAKALENYQSYVHLVDQVYLKKEQEIARLARLGRELDRRQQRIKSLESERELSQSKLALAAENNVLIAENYKKQWLLIYGLLGVMVLLCLVAFFMYRNIRQQRINNNLLALKSLRTQMNPHFIFNALNSVNSFIAMNDERTANRYLSDFSKLMRSVLENSEKDFIPLSKEVELLQLYTQLEHFRFQDKFDYEFEVDDAIPMNDFFIPPMLLQPYIENAVWHGLRYKDEKGKLLVRFENHTSEELRIIVEDDGIGREKSKALKTQNQKKQVSKGMDNIKQRIGILNDMYKEKVTISVEDLPQDGGTRVIVLLKKMMITN